MEKDFSTIEELDKTYSDHLDSLLSGGFMVKDSPEHSDFMGAWAEAVKDWHEAKAQPRWKSDL